MWVGPHDAAVGDSESPLRLELISSVAVFEADALRDQPIDEETPLEAWQGIQLGYSQTKWVTDRMVRACGGAGLPVTVPPASDCWVLCGSTWHEGDLLQRLLMGALALVPPPISPGNWMWFRWIMWLML